MRDTTRSARGANALPPAATGSPTASVPSVATTIPIGKIVRSESHVRYTCQVFGPGETPGPPEPGDYAFGSFVRVPIRIHPDRPDISDVADISQFALSGPGRIPSAPPSDTLNPRYSGHFGHPDRSPDAPNPLPPSLAGKGRPGGGERLESASFPTGTRSPFPVLGEGGHGVRAWAIGLIYDTILLNPAFGSLGPRLSNDEQVPLFSPDYLSERAVLVSILLLGSVSFVEPGRERVSHGVPLVAPDLGAVVTAMSDAEVRAFHSFADDRPPGGGRPYLHMGYLPHAVAQDHPLLQIAMLQTVERLERLCPENAALLAIVKRNFAWRLKVQATG